VSLSCTVLGMEFQNPVLLAAGTCGFGRELREVLDLEALGGIVTKSVTLEPRAGNPAPRVAEIPGAMLNSVGLANPGVDAVARDHLPWLRDHVRRPRVWVSVAGHSLDEYVEVVSRLEDHDGFQAFELNLSCPNVGGTPFSLDHGALAQVVSAVRPRTARPLVVKLAPNAPDLAATAEVAVGAGADALTVVNTLPGLALDPGSGVPRLGAGAGGLSGPPLKAVGVAAVRRIRDRVDVPVVGVGGILTAEDAREYLLAGASLVQIGTGSFAAPRVGERVIRGLERERRSHA
jgi:dihydroorotate dehydrogenase (NAD+) catalytic subunit